MYNLKDKIMPYLIDFEKIGGPKISKLSDAQLSKMKFGVFSIEDMEKDGTRKYLANFATYIRNAIKKTLRERDEMLIAIRDEDGVMDVDDEYDIRLDFLHSLYYNIAKITNSVKNPRLGAWQLKSAMKHASEDKGIEFSKNSENTNKFFINPRFLRHVTEFNGSEEEVKQMVMNKLLESLPTLYKENYESINSQMNYIVLAQKLILKKFEEIMEDLQPKPQPRPSVPAKSSERYKTVRRRERRSEPYSRSHLSPPLGKGRSRRRRV
jgi:hypothetical protein